MSHVSCIYMNVNQKLFRCYIWGNIVNFSHGAPENATFKSLLQYIGAFQREELFVIKPVMT